MKSLPKTLDHWILYIQSIHFRALDLNLDRVRRVKHILHLRRRPIVIVVAGTNGKGSSVAMLESIFHCDGRKVGTFTSPHLIRYQERIRVSGVEVAEVNLIEAFSKIEIARGVIPLTFFEFGAIAALLLFQEAEVEIAILEVGLGGRLDAVNTENPDITLITPISMDHEHWLGNSREQIGKEKAGILKFRSKLVINDPDPPKSLLMRAKLLDCPLVRYGVDYIADGDGQHWNWRPMGPFWKEIRVEKSLPLAALAGDHQLINAAGVVSVLQLMGMREVISRVALENGLKSQFIRGRLETHKGPPEVIVDVAHNISAAECLLKYLEDHPVVGRTFCVFSALIDKPAEELVRICSSVVDWWYIAELSDKRAQPLKQLKNAMVSVGIRCVKSWKSPEEAFFAARDMAEPPDRIVVFGSTYLAGVILKILEDEHLHA